MAPPVVFPGSGPAPKDEFPKARYRSIVLKSSRCHVGKNGVAVAHGCHPVVIEDYRIVAAKSDAICHK
jgi:hypothetical protein